MKKWILLLSCFVFTSVFANEAWVHNATKYTIRPNKDLHKWVKIYGPVQHHPNTSAIAPGDTLKILSANEMMAPIGYLGTYEVMNNGQALGYCSFFFNGWPGKYDNSQVIACTEGTHASVDSNEGTLPSGEKNFKVTFNITAEY